MGESLHEMEPKLLYLATFVTVFGAVIALCKDLPDVEGDKKDNVRTFAVRWGVDALFKVSYTQQSLWH